jgi:FkbM family methyltransferase
LTEEEVEYQRCALCHLLWQKQLLRTPIVALDIGARDAFTDPRWTYLPPDMVELHGFEPDDAECETLNQRAKDKGRRFFFHPVALGRSTGQADFYQYVEPAANSFYPGNDRLLSRWCYTRELTLSSQFVLKAKVRVPVVSIADWARQNAIPDIDFCKLNVQGAELDVLMGAKNRLNKTLGIVAEQTFNETYVGAPLFGEVYEFIRRSGFTMFDIIGMNLVARTRSAIHLTEDQIYSRRHTWPRHQFFEGHFLYLKDPILAADQWHANSAFPLEKVLKVACLAEIFGQSEFAFELLAWLSDSPEAASISRSLKEIIKDAAAHYRSIPMGGPPPPEALVPPAPPPPPPPSDWTRSIVPPGARRVLRNLKNLFG